MAETFPFHMMIDEDSEAWSIVDKTQFSTLYPQNVEDLTDEMIDNINEHFYYRQIAFSSPTRFLRHFHRLVKERAYTWRKMLETEKALSDDEMTRNYDLHEETEHTNKGKEDGYNKYLPAVKTVITDETTNTNRLMDTPDGITSDIESYVSTAGKDTSKASSTTTQEGQNYTAFHNDKDDKIEIKNHRYGNIGIQTAADIVGGYRAAQVFDAYESVIFPEVGQLFLTVIDMDEIDLW